MKLVKTIRDWIRTLRHKKGKDSDVQWCLIGNIVKENLYGKSGHENKAGTKHFSPGTKVYCLPAQWGDGYDQILVIGRHRGSKRFVTMVISWKWITNWRTKVVYHPEVLRRLSHIEREDGRRTWASQEEVEQYVVAQATREKHA